MLPELGFPLQCSDSRNIPWNSYGQIFGYSLLKIPKYFLKESLHTQKKIQQGVVTVIFVLFQPWYVRVPDGCVCWPCAELDILNRVSPVNQNMSIISAFSLTELEIFSGLCIVFTWRSSVESLGGGRRGMAEGLLCNMYFKHSKAVQFS